jgi:hypothetical protein
MAPALRGTKTIKNRETFMRNLENQELAIVVGGEDPSVPDEEIVEDTEGGPDSLIEPD